LAESPAARLTRESGSSFYYAFRILPARKRAAIYALYSFCRVVDDCVDEEGGEGEAGLRRWQEEVDRCYAGRPATALGRELARALAEFPLPRASFEEILAGCRMDLASVRYATFADLRVYCERVASAVGLAAIEIFGYHNPGTRAYARELGVALQLTNILRDVGVDARRGRLYVPLEDLHRFGVSAEDLVARAAAGRAPSDGMRALLAFQAERARAQDTAAARLLPAEDRRSMLPAEIMGAVYRRLLWEVQRREYPWDTRVRLSRPRQAWIALHTLARSRSPA
jgi:phytoene synthase